MNREIKFRGKTKNEGWVFGNLCVLSDGVFILTNDQTAEYIGDNIDYHSQGMGCGLEDRNITDRYEAMEHGFNKAVERIGEYHPRFIEVDPKSVGQFTHFNDDDIQDIFEGDIIQFGAQNGSINAVKYIVSNGGFLVKDKWGDWQWLHNVVASTNCKIIGNIHDNPELLTK